MNNETQHACEGNQNNSRKGLEARLSPVNIVLVAVENRDATPRDDTDDVVGLSKAVAAGVKPKGGPPADRVDNDQRWLSLIIRSIVVRERICRTDP